MSESKQQPKPPQQPKTKKSMEDRPVYRAGSPMTQEDFTTYAQAIKTDEAQQKMYEIEISRMEEISQSRKRRALEEQAKALMAEKATKEAQLSIRDIDKKMMQAEEEDKQTSQGPKEDDWLNPLKTPEMAKAISEMNDVARDKFLQTIKEMEFQKMYPDLYQRGMLLDSFRGMSPQQVQQYNPIDEVSKTVALVKDIFTLQQSMMPAPVPQIASVVATTQTPFEAALQTMMLNILTKAVEDKLSPAPTAAALASEPGRFAEMTFDSKMNTYVPTKITYDQYRELDAERAKKIEIQEQKQADKEERKEVLTLVKEGMGKVGPLLGNLTKGRGQPMYYPGGPQVQPTPQQQQKTQSFTCTNVINKQTGEVCNNVVTFPVPPTQPIVTCPKCGMMWEIGAPGAPPPQAPVQPQAPPQAQVQQPEQQQVNLEEEVEGAGL